jgi:hypothetical protein
MRGRVREESGQKYEIHRKQNARIGMGLDESDDGNDRHQIKKIKPQKIPITTFLIQ